MKGGDSLQVRKLIPNKIQIDVGDIKARFEYALGKEQITQEQMDEVNKACNKIKSILTNVRRVRGKENAEQ